MEDMTIRMAAIEVVRKFEQLLQETWEEQVRDGEWET